LQKKWRRRFVFFRDHGDPNSTEAREILSKKPRRIRHLIALNWNAFFFAPFYLFALGFWRKGITLWALLFAVSISLEAAGIDTEAVPYVTNLAAGVYYMHTINYMYFVRRLRGKSGWNPFRAE